MQHERERLSLAYRVALWRAGCFEAAFEAQRRDPSAPPTGQTFEEFYTAFAEAARDFTADARLYPMPGDAVRLGPAFSGEYWKHERRAVAVLNGLLGEREDEYLLTCSAQEGGAFRGPLDVSCSGGPSFTVRAEDMTLVGNYLAEFWRWKDKPRADGRERYRLLVPLWQLERRPDMPAGRPRGVEQSCLSST